MLDVLLKEVKAANPSFQTHHIRSRFLNLDLVAHFLSFVHIFEMLDDTIHFFVVVLCVLTEAAYTYYKTLCQDASLKRRGKLEDRKKARHRRERVIRVSLNAVSSICINSLQAVS